MSNITVIPLLGDQVTRQLEDAMAAHKENPYNNIVILAVRNDGNSRTSSLWYAPEKRTSEVIGLLECAKFDMILRQHKS